MADERQKVRFELPTIERVNTGEKLKLRREEALLTQQELANKSGVGVRSIVRLENGGPEPRFSTLKKLAAALNIAPKELRTD